MIYTYQDSGSQDTSHSFALGACRWLTGMHCTGICVLQNTDIACSRWTAQHFILHKIATICPKDLLFYNNNKLRKMKRRADKKCTQTKT